MQPFSQTKSFFLRSRSIITKSKDIDNTLERINKAALSFLAPLTKEEVYTIIAQEAVRLIGGLYASVILEQEGKLVRVYSTAPHAFRTKLRRKGYTRRAFEKRKVFILDASKAIQAHPELKDFGTKTTVFIPLAYRGRSIGVLNVASARKLSHEAKETNVLKIFGSMATLAVKKAQLLDELKQAVETRDLFIGMAAHELRTPLTTMSVYIDLLKKKFAKSKNGNGTADHWLEILSWEALRLTRLIDDLLTVNRIKTGKFHYELKACSLREVVHRALLNFTSTHPQREVEIEDKLETTDTVVGDFDKLLQVVTNLLDNAAKFSPTETKITLRLYYKRPYFTVEVQDLGKGIDEKDLPRVFDSFFRGSNNPKGGIGLGLFLAKSIITNHRGTIAVDSKINSGTTVRIRLPKSNI